MIIEDRYLVAKKKTNTYRHVAEKWSRYVWFFLAKHMTYRFGALYKARIIFFDLY